jgi:hypothetical protein
MIDLPLDQINVGKRRRQDLGDIEALMASIRDRGLLQPLVITPDLWLLSGFRRLEAIRRLGYSRVNVTVAADAMQALRLLVTERAEKTCREPFTPSEAVELVKVLKELVSGKSYQAGPGMQRVAKACLPGKCQTRSKLAAVISGMSGSTLAKAEVVLNAANTHPELIPIREEMDRTGKVDPAYKLVLKALSKTSTTDRDSQRPQPKTVPVEEAIHLLAAMAKRLGQITRADFYDKRSGTLINEKKCERCMANLFAARCFLDAIAARIARFLEDPLGKVTDELGNRRPCPECHGAKDT